MGAMKRCLLEQAVREARARARRHDEKDPPCWQCDGELPADMCEALDEAMDRDD